MIRRLLALTGPRAGVRYELAAGSTVVGRASDSGIQVLEDAVSRHHARFVCTDGQVTVEDLGSQNGTRLNGQTLSGPRLLTPSDVVEIGATTFVFEPRLEYLRGDGPDVIWAEDATATAALARPVTGELSSQEASEAAAAALAGLAEDARPKVLVRSALERLTVLFGATRGFVVRAGPELETARVVASVGEGPITVSRTLVQAVLQGPTALFSQDASTDAVLAAGVSLRLGGVRAVLAAPLVVGRRTLGLVALDTDVPKAFSPADVDRLLPHAQVLGLVLLAQERLLAERPRIAAAAPEAPEVIAEAPATQRVLEALDRAAATSASVLLTGPTGAGKEVFARRLHAQSDRAAGPFVAVNCGAVGEGLQDALLFGHVKGAFTGASEDRPGLFEAAHGGTLFLDEVGETSRGLQVKLLRALQERVITRIGDNRARAVDVRVVAATHRRLDEMRLDGRFRDDLYFRLAVVKLEIPALAARREDIVPLARRFGADVAREAGRPTPELTETLEAALEAHAWPGNVRELRNLMERLVILGGPGPLDVTDLPTEMWSGADAARRAVVQAETLGEAIARLERAMILKAMVHTGGVKTAAAESLGISRVTLDAKVRAHGIEWRRG